MFSRLSAFAIMAALYPATSATAQTAFPNGVWRDTQNRLTVRISPCAGSLQGFCGVLLQDNRPRGPLNPLNHLFVRDLRAVASGWRGLALDHGHRVNFTVDQIANDRARVTFCLAGFFCLRETVFRIPDPRPRAAG